MYTIEWKRKAAKNLEKIPKEIASKIREKIAALVKDPRPPGCQKLEGYEDSYRIRQGDYRVVYTLEEDRLIVTIIDVAPRSSIYRNL